MPWRDPCTPHFEGRAVGNSPFGGCRGDGENARGVTAIRQVAGAHLAYHFLPVSDTEHQGQDNPNFKHKY